MIKGKNIKAIRELIEYGFDARLISFEFNIPIEEVLEYKEELKCEEQIHPDNYQQVQKMRRNYSKLFYNTSDEKKETSEIRLSERSKVFVEKIIGYVEKKCEEIKECKNLAERRLIAEDILLKLKAIKGYPLEMDEAERLYNIINIEQLKGLKKYSTDKIDNNLDSVKKDCIGCMVKEISAKIDQITNIEELKGLERRITLDMRKKYPMVLGNVENKISQKRAKIQEKQAIEKINNIPTTIIPIIRDLANGNLDIEKANFTIEAEIAKNMKNSSKGKFALNEQQHRKMILMQIRRALTERSEEFPIQNPNFTMWGLQKLDKNNTQATMNSVVENLIKRREFENATNICNQFSSVGNDMDLIQCAIKLKTKIRDAKFSDFVLSGIKMTLPFEEEDYFMQLLEYGLQKEKINLEEISLGKNQDGSRRISLADIWPEEKIR